MKVCCLEIGSSLYDDAIKLRYELFFKQHDLPLEIVSDKYEEESRHVAIVDNKSLIAYGRITFLNDHVCQLSQIVVCSGQLIPDTFFRECS